MSDLLPYLFSTSKLCLQEMSCDLSSRKTASDVNQPNCTHSLNPEPFTFSGDLFKDKVNTVVGTTYRSSKFGRVIAARGHCARRHILAVTDQLWSLIYHMSSVIRGRRGVGVVPDKIKQEQSMFFGRSYWCKLSFSFFLNEGINSNKSVGLELTNYYLLCQFLCPHQSPPLSRLFWLPPSSLERRSPSGGTVEPYSWWHLYRRSQWLGMHTASSPVKEK